MSPTNHELESRDPLAVADELGGMLLALQGVVLGLARAMERQRPGTLHRVILEDLAKLADVPGDLPLALQSSSTFREGAERHAEVLRSALERLAMDVRH